MNRSYIAMSFVACIVFLIMAFGSRFFITIPAGHIGVATLFGEVQLMPYKEGLHYPTNPLYQWYFFDTRQKTLEERASVPSQDQQLTQIDVSVQYRIMSNYTPNILQNTGNASEAVSVHLIPTLRSQLREQGKAIARAEDFFLEKTQNQLQNNLEAALKDYLTPKGIEIQAVLLRDIKLPAFITRAIESKKEREQAAEKQKAELDRYTTEQQQKVVQAKAEREAAEETAHQRRVLADVQAYEIEQVNNAISENPAYIQLKALDALKVISENPASQIYFINGDSPTPLPLMHLGVSSSSGIRKI